MFMFKQMHLEMDLEHRNIMKIIDLLYSKMVLKKQTK